MRPAPRRARGAWRGREAGSPPGGRAINAGIRWRASATAKRLVDLKDAAQRLIGDDSSVLDRDDVRRAALEGRANSRFVNANVVTVVPKDVNEYRLLSWAGTVSRFLQGGGPRVVQDFGVPALGDKQRYGWVVWHAPYNAGDWVLPRIVARAGEPVVRSHWDVHVEESARLAYLVKDACEPADTEADFFVETLETDAAEHGFHDVAFSFGYWGVAAGGRCVAAVELPEHGVEGMTVGQHGVWSEVVRLTAP